MGRAPPSLGLTLARVLERTVDDQTRNYLDGLLRTIESNAAEALKVVSSVACDNQPRPHETESFLLEWYKLQRAHELELNKVTLAYEHERLKFLALLNGGAAAAYLAAWKDLPRGAPYFGMAAVISWILGLVLAWCSWDTAYAAQRDFTKAYRKRRNAEETRRLTKSFSNFEARAMLGTDIDEPTSDAQRAAADSARTTADGESKRISNFAKWSVTLFVLGALMAALGFAVNQSENAQDLTGSIKALVEAQVNLVAIAREQAADGFIERQRTDAAHGSFQHPRLLLFVPTVSN